MPCEFYELWSCFLFSLWLNAFWPIVFHTTLSFFSLLSFWQSFFGYLFTFLSSFWLSSILLQLVICVKCLILFLLAIAALFTFLLVPDSFIATTVCHWDALFTIAALSSILLTFSLLKPLSSCSWSFIEGWMIFDLLNYKYAHSLF